MQLEALHFEVHERTYKKLCFFASQQNPLRFAKRVSNTPYFRFRIGDYRILFEMYDDSIHIAKIERRDKAYD